MLRLEDLEVGAPGAGEMRLRIEAIGLNRSEAAFRAGQYPVKPKFPTLMGYEACGIVEALGDGVQDFKVGERVCVLPTYRLGEYGVYAERAIVPARSVLAAPPGLSSDRSRLDLDAVPHRDGHHRDHARDGRRLRDHPRGLEQRRARGDPARELGRARLRSPPPRRSDKRQALLDHGAKHVIATEETDLVAEVMKITNGKGARIVFDPVGGPYVQTLAQAMAVDGTLFIYGGLSGQPTMHPHWPAAFKNLSIRGWVASTIWNHPERFARSKDADPAWTGRWTSEAGDRADVRAG